AAFRNLLINIVGLVGVLQAAFGLVRGVVAGDDFAHGETIVLMLLGLIYIGAYIGLQDLLSDRGYKAALGLGAAGLAGFLIGLVLSLLPAAAISARVPEPNYFVPAGLCLMGMSLLYVTISLAICVDWPIVVLTRRELASYFFSPVAY